MKVESQANQQLITPAGSSYWSARAAAAAGRSEECVVGVSNDAVFAVAFDKVQSLQRHVVVLDAYQLQVETSAGHAH